MAYMMATWCPAPRFFPFLPDLFSFERCPERLSHMRFLISTLNLISTVKFSETENYLLKKYLMFIHNGALLEVKFLCISFVS